MKPSLRYLWLLGLWWSSGAIVAQSVVVNNPSQCSIGLNLMDGACDPNVNVIPDPERVDINVNNAPLGALGVSSTLQEVQLIITHTWANDLDIRLTSPAGISIVLSTDNGGGNDNYGDAAQAGCTGVVRFNMASCTSIADGVPPFTDQAYRPEGSFYDFNDGVTDANSFWELSICDDAQGDFGRLEYVNLVFAPMSCLPVETLEVTNTDTTTVTIDWQPSTSCGNSELEYGPPGFAPGTGSTVSISGCPPYELTGLLPDTEYELYARNDCAGTLSPYSCPIVFTTSCLPPPVSLRSDFDALPNCPGFCNTACGFDVLWENGLYNEYDWLVDDGGTLTAGTGPSDDVSGGGNYLYLEASGQFCGGNKTAYLVSNCLQFDRQGTDTCHLSFSYHMFGDGTGTLSLQASDDGGFTWDTLWTKSGNQGDQWHKAYIGLDVYPDGSTLQFRFVGEEGNNPRGDMALDEILFYGSTDLGDPPFTYFVDADSDGYGDSSLPLYSCASSAPPGYSSLFGDCDDADNTINPLASEIPCNNTDENCNGNADDPVLPPPTVNHDTICPGETATLCASNFTRFIFWYGSPSGVDLVGFGPCFSPNSSLLINNGPTPVTYTFYAEESDGICSSGIRAAATVTVNPQPVISVLDNPEICPGNSYDLASLSVSDANLTGSSLSFHTAQPTNPVNQLPSTVVSPAVTTTYSYRAEASTGCFDEGSFLVEVQPAFTLNFDPGRNFSLCQESFTTLTALAQSGGSYTYQWDTGATNDNIVIQAGTSAGATSSYAVTATNAQGCSVSDTATVSTTVSIDTLRRFVTDVSTCAGSDGSITLIPLDGLSPFSYQWTGTNGVVGDSTGVTDTLVIDNLPQGAYRITVTDDSPEACSIVLRSVLVNGPGAVVQGVDVDTLNCFGSSDGAICLSIFGGTPTINWSGGQSTACISGLAGGNYSVTVTEGTCQTILSNIEVPEPLDLKLDAVLSPPSCDYLSDGHIDLSVFGGTPPYTYSWSNFVTFEDPANLAAGSYTVTVTDFNGCSIMQTFLLTAPPSLSTSPISQQNISCNGLTDGQVQVAASGGTLPYQYAWDNGSSSELNINLAAGSYTVTTTDFNGCRDSLTLNIVEPAPISLSVVATENPECVGEKDGKITVAASGGTAPYQYSWNLMGTDSILENLPVGLYFAYATDANNCPPDTLAIELDAVSVLDLTVSISAPFCEGLNTGSIALSPMGTPPFSYNWLRGDTTSAISAVGVGEYPVRIEDGQGCLYDTSFTVTAPQVFGASVGVIQPACAGSADGLLDVDIFAPGGAPPYIPPISYDWSDGGSGATRLGLGDGWYQVSISDAQGCTFISDTITLQSPTNLDLSLEGLGLLACHADTTGFIEVNVRGGVPPYSYNWIGEDVFTEDLFDVGAGAYRLLVLDANNCPMDTTFLLPAPPPLSVGIVVDAEDPCVGGVTEEICGQPSGGILPYQFQWSSGDTTACIDLPAPDDYILTVTDANGCVIASNPQKVQALTGLFQIDTFYTSGTSCHDAMDGCAVVEVSGGSTQYNYHFSDSFLEDKDSSSYTYCGLAAGNYQVTVTDLSSGCVVASSVIALAEPQPLQFQRDSVDAVSCFGSNSGAVYTSTTGGTMPYAYSWLDENGVAMPDTTASLFNLGEGMYTGLVVDAQGCTAEVIATITAATEPLRDTLVNIVDVACKGDSSGAIMLTVLGGAPPYQYDWSNGSTAATLPMLPAGTYTLTVTDSDTCQAVFPAWTVTEPDSVITINAQVDSTSCHFSTDGAISVAVNGGMMPYSYVWDYEGASLPVMNTNVVSSLQAGDYGLQLEDSNGCTQWYTFTVHSPDSLLLTIDLTSPVPPSSGTATAIATGGVQPYTYLWSTGDTTSNIPVDGGNYTVSVTDANLCIVTGAVSISGTYEASEAIQEALCYPNPTTGRVSLMLQLQQPTAITTEVYSAVGQRVLPPRKLDRQALHDFDVDFSSLPNGSYWIVVSDQERLLYTSSIIKQ